MPVEVPGACQWRRVVEVGACQRRRVVGGSQVIPSARPMDPWASQEQAGEEPSATWRGQRKCLDGSG